MKKIAILVISLMIISVVFLSGCTEQQDTNTPSDNNQLTPLDTDGDGYPDTEDDFPTDSSLYKKRIVNSDERHWQLTEGEWEDITFNYGSIPSGHFKYVVVTMHSTNDIYFNIASGATTLFEQITSDVYQQYYITDELKGDWRVWGRNDNKYSAQVDITVEQWS